MSRCSRTRSPSCSSTRGKAPRRARRQAPDPHPHGSRRAPEEGRFAASVHIEDRAAASTPRSRTTPSSPSRAPSTPSAVGWPDRRAHSMRNLGGEVTLVDRPAAAPSAPSANPLERKNKDKALRPARRGPAHALFPHSAHRRGQSRLRHPSAALLAQKACAPRTSPAPAGPARPPEARRRHGHHFRARPAQARDRRRHGHHRLKPQSLAGPTRASPS